MLKDITLGQYFPGNTPVHRLDPRTKLLLVVVYIVALFLCKWFASYGLMAAFLVTAVALSRIRPKALFKGLKPLLIIILFTALLNLFLGLKMPNLHWTSEITPIKQSGAVAIALLGGWAYAAAMAALYFLVGRHMGFAAYMAAFLALTLAAAVLLYIWVRKRGCAIFASL